MSAHLDNEPADETDESQLSDSMRFALGMVESMGHQGLAAVPIKPTMEMLLAGARAGDVTVETAWNVYTSMLKAAG